MKYFNFIVLTVALGCKLADSSAIDQSISKAFAEVKVERMFQRSLGEAPAYRVHINGLGESLKLNLRSPSESIFAKNFQYHEASTDPETGELIMSEATPSAEELQAIEKNFYTDVESNAAVSMKRNENSDAYQFSGRIQDMTITPQGENTHQLVRKASTLGRNNDYVDLNRTVEPGKTSRATSMANPEVFVIWDYAASEQFGFNRNKILDYVGVFFHAVNNRFATSQDPQIVYRLTGVTAITQKSAQPYMENNRVSGGYDIDKTLEDLSSWLYQNKGSTPKYDLATLISNTDMKAKESDGSYSSGVAGLAYLKGACWNYDYGKRYLGCSVTEDLEGYYDGAFSVAHELAHNMGAPHDGDEGATQCPWSQGYLMSYEGWGTKQKFYFSQCSRQLMKNLIESDKGACVKTTQADTNVPISNENTGDRFDMKAMCVKLTKQSEAVPDPDTDPNTLCKNLKCRFPTPGKPAGWYSIQTSNQPARDNSPCGNGGRCRDGDCVGAR